MSERQKSFRSSQNSQGTVAVFYLVQFNEGSGGAGVYKKSLCLYEDGKTCAVKFGAKNHRGNILLKGSYDECLEKGYELGLFSKSGNTPKRAFTFVKDKQIEPPSKKVKFGEQSENAVSHVELIKTMNSGLDNIDLALAELDQNVLSVHASNNLVVQPQKQSISGLKVTKKKPMPSLETSNKNLANTNINNGENHRTQAFPALNNKLTLLTTSTTNMSSSIVQNKAVPPAGSTLTPHDNTGNNVIGKPIITEERMQRLLTQQAEKFTKEISNLKKEITSKNKKKKMV
jgi:hypothetical protein